MAYTAIGLREKKGLSLSQQSSEQITQRFTQYENNSYKANFLIRDSEAKCHVEIQKLRKKNAAKIHFPCSKHF